MVFRRRSGLRYVVSGSNWVYASRVRSTGFDIIRKSMSICRLYNSPSNPLQEVQLGVRTAVGIIMTCLPLATSLNPLEFMITCAGLTVFLVIEETIGKLHREGIQSKRKVENSKPMHDYDENLEGQKSETNRPVPEEKDKDQ